MFYIIIQDMVCQLKTSLIINEEARQYRVCQKPIRIMPEHQAVGAITAGTAVPPFQRLTLISPIAMLRVSEFKQRKSIQLLKTCICWSTILNPALVLIYTLVVIILQYSIIIIIREIWYCVRVRGVVGPSVV